MMEFVIPKVPEAIPFEEALTEKGKLVHYGGGKYAGISSIKDDENETNHNKSNKSSDTRK